MTTGMVKISGSSNDRQIETESPRQAGLQNSSTETGGGGEEREGQQNAHLHGGHLRDLLVPDQSDQLGGGHSGSK